ncbi:MAG: ATP synthase F1 subunit epsilon [Verrucomicrobiota bacterium]
MAIALKIVTPDAVAFDETVDSVILPTAEGQMGVLPGHIPVLAQIEAGQLRVARDGGTESLAIDKGFAEVCADTVAILTEAAIDVADINLDQVKEAKERAKKAIEEADDSIDPAELERLEATVRFALAQEITKASK